MTKDAPPIPPEIWARMLAFLKEDKDGKIVLRVRRGTVLRAAITEHVGAKALVHSGS